MATTCPARTTCQWNVQYGQRDDVTGTNSNGAVRPTFRGRGQSRGNDYDDDDDNYDDDNDLDKSGFRIFHLMGAVFRLGT